MGDAKRPIPLHEPCFSGNEWAYVKDCLDTGWVSSVGKYVDKFEEMLCEFTGVKRPGTGTNPMRWDEMIGQDAQKDYEKDELV